MTVGTDVHPFERLMLWTQQLLDKNPWVEAVVQHGTSPPVDGARNTAMMGGREFARALDSADVVVAQGGPGGIMEARQSGHLPIVVPRTRALGEHVDDHQVAFSQLLANQGLIKLATDRPAFLSIAGQMLAHPQRQAGDQGDAAGDAARAISKILERPSQRPTIAQFVRLTWQSVRPVSTQSPEPAVNPQYPMTVPEAS